MSLTLMVRVECERFIIITIEHSDLCAWTDMCVRFGHALYVRNRIPLDAFWSLERKCRQLYTKCAEHAWLSTHIDTWSYNSKYQHFWFHITVNNDAKLAQVCAMIYDNIVDIVNAATTVQSLTRLSYDVASELVDFEQYQRDNASFAHAVAVIKSTRLSIVELS